MGSAAHAITDLVLGLVTLTCAVLLLRVPGINRSWHLTFWFAGASALAGAAHHGLFLFRAGRSWTVVGALIGLDSTSLSHLAQIPGVLLLYRAVARGARSQ